MDQPLDIGSRRELFVDEFLIDTIEGAALRLQEPRPGGVAIAYDRPWESSIAFYTTVLKDGDVYRMYYRAANLAFNPTSHPDDHLFPTATCYAESADGISWTKPDLGLVELKGSKRNNAILPGRPVYPFGPFVDGRPGVPAEERYKAVARHVGGPQRHLMAYTSADGIHWRTVRDEPIIPQTLENNFDSQNVAFWSEAEGRYVAYVRHMVGGRRSTARATSADFLDWSEQTLMSYSDTGTTVPSQHLYTNQTQPYLRAPHIYVAMPGRIHFGRRPLSAEQARAYESEIEPISGGAGDVSDGVLLTSRAGATRYDFTFKESFVRPGIGSEDWTSRCNYPALGVVQTGPSGDVDVRPAAVRPERGPPGEADAPSRRVRLPARTVRRLPDGDEAAHFRGPVPGAQLCHERRGQHPGRGAGPGRPAHSGLHARGVPLYRRQ